MSSQTRSTTSSSGRWPRSRGPATTRRGNWVRRRLRQPCHLLLASGPGAWGEDEKHLPMSSPAQPHLGLHSRSPPPSSFPARMRDSREGAGPGRAGLPGGDRRRIEQRLRRHSHGLVASGRTVGEAGVWVVNAGDSTVSRIDAVARRPGVTLGLGIRLQSGQLRGEAYEGDLAVGEGAAWFAAPGRRGLELVRIDPGTNVVGEPIVVDTRARGAPIALAVGEEAVWLTNLDGDIVLRMDPVTLEVVERMKVGRRPRGVAGGRRRLGCPGGCPLSGGARPNRAASPHRSRLESRSGED